MKSRHIRPYIFVPVVKLGVADRDWAFAFAISCLGFAIPFILNLQLFRVPVCLWSWLVCSAGAIAFFNYIRVGRRPFWLQHRLRDLFRAKHAYGRRPMHRKGKRTRPWSDIEGELPVLQPSDYTRLMCEARFEV